MKCLICRLCKEPPWQKQRSTPSPSTSTCSTRHPEEKTAHANEIAREFGVGEDALAAVEDFKKELTKHNAWDLPFMGYVNEDGYGYAYVPNAAITTTPYWDAHAAFLALPKDAQTAFAIRMLFTHRPVDRYGADMFLHYQRGISTNFIGTGANKY